MPYSKVLCVCARCAGKAKYDAEEARAGVEDQALHGGRTGRTGAGPAGSSRWWRAWS